MALTPTTVDNGTAVYTTLPTGLGLQVGMEYQTVNTSHRRMLVQNDSGGNLTGGAGDVLIWSTQSSYKVTASSAIQQPVIGINDIASGTIANGSYFWMTIRGPVVKVKTTGSPAANTILVTTATAGTLGAVGANVTDTRCSATANAVSNTNAAWLN